ncbi:amidohydrolase [Comamonas jiangduensis]|uniref:amidohydrolase n=1 Tax=Comamonas jiangduensis TaxID=1194168 RepID=UPI0028ADFB76|nr:amidohydrolase [Comamonas jiangduensis]
MSSKLYTFNRLAAAAALVCGSLVAQAAEVVPTPWVVQSAKAVESQVIDWRRHIHQHPELGNLEVKTAAMVAKELKKMGLQVHTGIAGTGVVAVLQGGLPGPTVGLRADMDALPVKETSGLPFASQAKGMYFGKEVDVMHACGHDAHTAMLLGAASVLSQNKDKVPGKVVFIFQPAEEGGANIDVFDPKAPSWGAKRMVEEGVMEKFGIESVFGVHVMSNAHAGEIQYKVGAALNSADGFRIKLEGKQAHGSMPWTGADPIVASANVINGMQTLVSRQASLSEGMGVVTVGSIHGGTAGNIVTGEVTMEGTIRSNAPGIRNTLTGKLPEMVTKTAEAQGVHADVHVAKIMPVTMNDANLTRAMVPALQKASDGKATETFVNQAASEDFSYYAEKVPGLFVFLGGTPKDQDPAKAASNHNPGFFVDESTLITGVRSHVEFVLGYADYAKTLTK